MFQGQAILSFILSPSPVEKAACALGIEVTLVALFQPSSPSSVGGLLSVHGCCQTCLALTEPLVSCMSVYVPALSEVTSCTFGLISLNLWVVQCPHTMGLRVKGVLCPPFPTPPPLCPPLASCAYCRGLAPGFQSLYWYPTLTLCVVPGARVFSGGCLTLRAQIPTICPWGPDPQTWVTVLLWILAFPLMLQGKHEVLGLSASVTLIVAIVFCAYPPPPPTAVS